MENRSHSLISFGLLIALAAAASALSGDGIDGVSSYPNPFDSRKQNATIVYTLPSSADVSIKIFSVYGTPIKTMNFASGGAGGMAGVNAVPWNGADDSGAKTSKGIYLAVIAAGPARATWKIGVIH